MSAAPSLTSTTQATTPGVVIPAYIAQLAAHSTLSLSPKVSIPAIIGSTTFAAVCELTHYGVHVDWGTVCLAIVSGMVALGWIVPDGARAVVQQTVQHALATQTSNGEEAK